MTLAERYNLEATRLLPHLAADLQVDPAITRAAEIDAMLARLQRLSDDHFNAHPNEINWGHVGTLEHYASLMKRITDSAFGEGEFAD